MPACAATDSDQLQLELHPTTTAVVASSALRPTRTPSKSSRCKEIDRELCHNNKEGECLQALNSSDNRRKATVESTVRVPRKRSRHRLCDRVVVVIVVVGILFMMCTVLAALYLLLRILLSPATQRNSPFGIAAFGNMHRHAGGSDNTVEVKELIDKARRLLSSSIGTRFIQPRGRLKNLPYGLSQGPGAIKQTMAPALVSTAPKFHI
jgi:hypothetical protein